MSSHLYWAWLISALIFVVLEFVAFVYHGIISGVVYALSALVCLLVAHLIDVYGKKDGAS